MQITKKDVVGGKTGLDRLVTRLTEARVSLLRAALCFKEMEKHEVDKELSKMMRFLDSIKYKD